MKVLKLALVLLFAVSVLAGCGGGGGTSDSGGGGGDFDSCVTAGMAQVEKQAGSPQPAAKPTIEQGCQVCKDQPGSDACKMIIDAYKK